MQNKTVGLLIIGITVLIGFIIFIFNQALAGIVQESCAHGPACPMWGTIEVQTIIGIGIMIFILTIGLYLIFFGDKGIKKKKIDYTLVLKEMKEDERAVFEPIIKSGGLMFQSEIVKKTNYGKVKVSRILDRLENRGILERKRKGMSNLIMIKTEENQ